MRKKLKETYELIGASVEHCQTCGRMTVHYVFTDKEEKKTVFLCVVCEIDFSKKKKG